MLERLKLSTPTGIIPARGTAALESRAVCAAQWEDFVLDRARSWLDRLTAMHLLALCFLAAILVGTGLLLLPWATKEPLSVIDALFTATSSVCVTGLIVAEPGTEFTGFGQAVILGLIQLGGLGIMTASSFLLLALGGRASLRNLNLLRDEYTLTGHGSARQLILTIAAFTLIVEAVGAIILSHRFAAEPSLGQNPVWCGVFHSVSAFCNAGFSLFPASFCHYRGDPTINLVVPLLIVLGGIGFPALNTLVGHVRARFRGEPHVLNLHVKIVLGATAALVVLGMVAFLALESPNELKDAPVGERGGAAWFQSVTTRTAGFNAMDFAKVSEPTLLVTIVLMTIGGSPGSTAGGIKTTTFVVILLIVLARLRGHDRVEAGKRTIPNVVITKALTVAILGVALIVVATLFLLVTDGPALGRVLVERSARHGSFVSLLFEVVSAFGTVGLSVIDTATAAALTWPGKLVIICVMYLGRLGPLALAQMVLTADRPLNYKYPEEYLLVG